MAEERWRWLVAVVPDSILITDREGTIQYVNRTGPAELVADVIGSNVRDRSYPEYHDRIRECMAGVLRSGESGSVETEGPRHDGSGGWHSNRVGPCRQGERIVGLAWIVTDITESKEALEKLQRSERLVSVGTLAAGIAHEINNPVGGILLSAQSALDELDDPRDRDFVRKCLHEIRDDAKRCGRIIRSVLRFARQEPTERWPNDINALVRRVQYLTQGVVAQSNGKFTLNLAAELPMISVSPIEIEQVLVNLVHNAMDAGDEGTRITISTALGDDGIRVLVADDGPGIAPPQIEHIFDPFFTTRQQSGGTGLGLSVVHGIIQAHGGTIDVSSSPEQGTVFVIELPC